MLELIDDLVAEQDALEESLSSVAQTDWERPCPAEGWLLRDCVAHLAEGDAFARHVTETRRPVSPPPAKRLPGDLLSGGQLDARALPVPELVDWWRRERAGMAAAFRTCKAKERLPWAGRQMSARSLATSRLSECWSHGLDALEAADRPPIVSDRLRHVAHIGYITREFAYGNRGLPPPNEPLRVELEAPSGATWAWGPENAASRITGPAFDFCRLVNQRVHPSDTRLVATGAEAAEFLQVAQAFAGPPGSGRSPRGRG